jgi:hypothetical protein
VKLVARVASSLLCEVLDSPSYELRGTSISGTDSVEELIYSKWDLISGYIIGPDWELVCQHE